MNKDAFKKYGYQFIDWVADYLDGVEDFPVTSHVAPGEIRRQIPIHPPDREEPLDRVFKDFCEIVLPGMAHWQHPSWFAYFPASNSPPSILAELLTAGLGAQCMVWQTSPAAQELEESVIDWLRQMLGLPEGMSGVIQDTASTATLCALVCARESATGFRSNEQGVTDRLVVYASKEAHSGVEKGVKITGYGRENLRYIPVDASFAMIPEALAQAIAADRQNGLIPACVVATVGTTASAALDPLVPIGRICRENDIWLHVDAAYAGTAAILPEKQWIFNGVEQADSLVFNPHKWMLTNFDCSAYFVRDESALIRAFEIQPEYLKTPVDTSVKNYRDWGIQLGRRFRALKLWFVIRSYGVEGLQRIIREHIRLAKLFESWVAAHAHFEVVAPVDLGLVCFRLNNGQSEDALNDLNKKLLKKINGQTDIFLTHAVLGSTYVLRMAIGSRLTKERHVAKAWQTILRVAFG
ncbi:MAG: pyridoxal-dependent decarboxylase [Myxococcota bacterium]|nr:pyridoxal-dependent decarboxylase [Myxococcota bacterium]